MCTYCVLPRALDVRGETLSPRTESRVFPCSPLIDILAFFLRPVRFRAREKRLLRDSYDAKVPSYALREHQRVDVLAAHRGDEPRGRAERGGRRRLLRLLLRPPRVGRARGRLLELGAHGRRASSSLALGVFARAAFLLASISFSAASVIFAAASSAASAATARGAHGVSARHVGKVRPVGGERGRLVGDAREVQGVALELARARRFSPPARSSACGRARRHPLCVPRLLDGT